MLDKCKTRNESKHNALKRTELYSNCEVSARRKNVSCHSHTADSVSKSEKTGVCQLVCQSLIAALVQ